MRRNIKKIISASTIKHDCKRWLAVVVAFSNLAIMNNRKEVGTSTSSIEMKVL